MREVDISAFALNRMNDLIDRVRTDGQVLVDNVDVYDRRVDVVELRKRIGMIFQKSNPLSQVDLRKRRLWPSHQWNAGSQAAR